MQFGDDEEDGTTYLQRGRHPRKREASAGKRAATPPQPTPQMGGAAAAAAARKAAPSTSSGRLPQAQRDDTLVNPDSPWGWINDPDARD